MPEAVYVGAMNDALFIIDKPPRPGTDDINPNHEVTIIATCYGEGRTGIDTANLLTAAYNSYRKNCGPRAAAAARTDMLGEAIALLRECLVLTTGIKTIPGAMAVVEIDYKAVAKLHGRLAAFLAKLPTTDAVEDGDG